MALRITATDAKNKFGDLLELAAWHGRVDIVRHGRVVASVVAPRAIEELEKQSRHEGGKGGDCNQPEASHDRIQDLCRHILIVQDMIHRGSLGHEHH